MEALFEKLIQAVEAGKQTVLDAERYIWKHPEAGYKEWKTHAYLKEQYEMLGYHLTEFGNIPGFYTDIDTGRPGPTVAVFGEMDSLIIPSHPEADPETGCVHACGHNCQSAALLGIAVAFKEKGALDGLCGVIRLIAVPAEELIDVEYRKELREKGVIKYFGGKVELIYRGILDDVDVAMMVHTTSNPQYSMTCPDGTNGCIVKKATFIGKSSHAGGSPYLGRNALYAAQTAMSAVNALRETFRDQEHIRFHPIITEGGTVVNAIPDHVVVESYVRGATMDAIASTNEKVNRAFAAAAAAFGCRVILDDQNGYAPRFNDPNLIQVFLDAAELFFPASEIRVGGWGSGCSDMGDVSTLIPSVHPNIGGAVGAGHGTDYFIADPEKATVTSAKLQSVVLAKLLMNDAALAKKVIAEKKVTYANREEYLAAIDALNHVYDAVSYRENGDVALHFIG